MKRNSFLIGSIILFLSSVATKFLGAFYKIPLTKILGSSGLGIYQMIFPIYVLFVTLSSSGIVVALSKSIASSKSKQKSKQYFKAGLFANLIFCVFFSILFCILSPLFASKQGNLQFMWCYLLVLPSIFLSGICSVFKGYFFGKNKMTFTGLALVLEQISKIIFAILFSKFFSQFGTIFSVCGALLGITVSEIIVVIYYFVIYKKRSHSKELYKKYVKTILKIIKSSNNFVVKTSELSFWKTVQELLRTSFFVTIQASILPLVSAIDGVIVVPILIESGINSSVAYSLFGLTSGLIVSLVSIPVVAATSIGSAIIPNIQKKSVIEISSQISFAIKIVWLVAICFVSIFFVMPKDITNFLFSNVLSTRVVDEFVISADILKISCFGTLYLCLLSLSTSILQGLGKSFVPARNLFFCALFRFVILFCLIKFFNLNIYAIQIADILFYGMCFAFNLLCIKKLANIKLSFFKTILFPIISAILMIFVIALLKKLLNDTLSPKILTAFIAGIGGLIYFSVLAITKAIDLKQIKSFIFKKQI